MNTPARCAIQRGSSKKTLRTGSARAERSDDKLQSYGQRDFASTSSPSTLPAAWCLSHRRVAELFPAKGRIRHEASLIIDEHGNPIVERSRGGSTLLHRHGQASAPKAKVPFLKSARGFAVWKTMISAYDCPPIFAPALTLLTSQ